MSIRAYVILGIIVLVSLLFIYACLRAARKADDDEIKWREKHEWNL